MTSSPELLIADDHPIIALALRAELTRAGFCVLNPVTSVLEIVEALENAQLRIIVTDFTFNEPGDGLQLLARINRLRPDVSVVVYSMLDSAPSINDVFVAGARAFVGKRYGASEVIIACKAVAEGKLYQSDNKAITVDSGEQQIYRHPSLDRISPREREVLRLLAQGLSVKEIGRMFNRSPKTISVQKCSAMAKLGLTEDIELARYLAMSE